MVKVAKVPSGPLLFQGILKSPKRNLITHWWYNKETMRYLILLLILFCFTPEAQSQKTWEGYYLEFQSQDDFLQTFKFPEPSSRQKQWKELRGKERRTIKNHLRVHYGVHPTTGGYIAGTFKTIGSSVGRAVIYIGTMAAVAVVAGVIFNQPASRI